MKSENSWCTDPQSLPGNIKLVSLVFSELIIFGKIASSCCSVMCNASVMCMKRTQQKIAYKKGKLSSEQGSRLVHWQMNVPALLLNCCLYLGNYFMTTCCHFSNLGTITHTEVQTQKLPYGAAPLLIKENWMGRGRIKEKNRFSYLVEWSFYDTT